MNVRKSNYPAFRIDVPKISGSLKAVTQQCKPKAVGLIEKLQKQCVC